MESRQNSPIGAALPVARPQTSYPYTVATSATTDNVLATAKPHSLLADYATLFKVRISTMVIITAGAGFYLGCLRSGISPFQIDGLKALVAIAVVTCGSSALNQALERKSDALMNRTFDRPMAAGRISLSHGLILGFAATFLGSAYLAFTTNLLTGTLTLLTAVGYVAIYTPLKRVTTINTFIGAFPGALPPLIGWTAARGMIEWPGVALFAILFVWQFPHFMAIGWMYREDYARAGIRLTTNLPNTQYAAQSTAIQALFYAALMIPVSLWPAVLHSTGYVYATVATVLGLGYLWYTIRFARITRDPVSDASLLVARNLLRFSVIYLPLLLAAMMLDAKGRLIF
ncbi:heme o synthase [Tunturiibacter lichenicola]|uniref:heme o synthase n=1 Tax=Tunturiibacter lichenicola TaxID=2051959 RepID=UPI003D9B631A